MILTAYISFFFFFNDTATTEIYTLSLHDALPIYDRRVSRLAGLKQLDNAREAPGDVFGLGGLARDLRQHVTGLYVIDRKSTRLNSSHLVISYAVFCLKKKKKNKTFYDNLINRTKT